MIAPMDAPSPPPAPQQPASVRAALPARAAAYLVAGAIGLSAFLLFALELLVGRLVLPAFGGSPAAWATVLFFFQGVLLVGYLYGHLVVTRLSVRSGAALHVVVVALAVVALLAVPARIGALRDPGIHPILDLLRVLTITVGAPTLVLTTTTPLLSAWYARLRGARVGDDPFWLYSMSNGASLAALLAYPFVIEPAMGLAAQRTAWGVGFVALALLLAAAATIMWTRARGGIRARVPDGPDGRPPEGAVAAADTRVDRRPTSRRRAAWILVAAVPAGLLAAVTNLVATDLVAAPMLWMGPLAIYLLSFVIAFSRRGRLIVPGALALTPVAVTLLWVPLGSVGAWPALPLLAIAYAGFAVVAVGLNGVLALDRPDADGLTEFYLLLAVGGVLGGSFVGVIAPLVFGGIWEYPILLVGTLVAVTWGAESGAAPAPVPASPPAAAEAASSATQVEAIADRGGRAAQTPVPKDVRRPRGLRLRPFVAGAPGRLVPYGVVGALLVLAVVPVGGPAVEAVVRWVAVGGVLLLFAGVPRFFVVATATVLVLVTFVLPAPALFQGRSFFAVTRVIASPDGRSISLTNGTTLHGIQATDPALRDEPTAYYVRPGPAGDLFAAARGPFGRRALDIAVAGLGSGGLATFAMPGDALTFLEIDPVVIGVATDPSLFTFLSDAAVPARIVEGDARLSLASTPDDAHDLVIVDVFSSDSPPAHMLTVEAIADAMRTVRPGGLLALHVSNRYYDLAPAVVGAAERLGLATSVRTYAPTQEARDRWLAVPSIWVAIARSPEDLSVLESRGWRQQRAVDPVTDDRPDLLRLLYALGG